MVLFWGYILFGTVQCYVTDTDNRNETTAEILQAENIYFLFTVCEIFASHLVYQ